MVREALHRLSLFQGLGIAKVATPCEPGQLQESRLARPGRTLAEHKSLHPSPHSPISSLRPRKGLARMTQLMRDRLGSPASHTGMLQP